MTIIEYVKKHTTRGSCECGQCLDAPLTPNQPTGHTADLVFFQVAAKDDPDADTFRALVEAEAPWWLDGQEYSYIHLGAEIGDQGLALQAMGLGSLLGLWTLLGPTSVLGPLTRDMALKMAGNGYLSIVAKGNDNDNR